MTKFLPGSLLSCFCAHLLLKVSCILLFFVLSFNVAAQTKTSTAAGGNWSAGGTWVGGVVPIANDNVIIATTGAGVVTLNANTATLTSLTINSGSLFTSTGGNTVNLIAGGAVTVNGTYTHTSTGLITNTAIMTVNTGGIFTRNGSGAIPTTTWNMNAGSTYNHAIGNAASVIPTATWNATSTCNITASFTGAFSIMPTGLGQTFGNFSWNATDQNVNLEFSAGFTTAGDFSVLSTNASALRISNSATSRTITVLGNYVQSGGNFTVVSGTGAGTLAVTGDFDLSGGIFLMKEDNGAAVLNVTGDFDQTGGAFDHLAAGTGTSIVTVTSNFSQSAGTYDMAATGTGTLNIAGNFSQTGGTITESGGTGSIIFNGPSLGTQTYTSGGTISNTINFTVNNGTTLQMAAAGTTVDGAGSFTLLAGATLGITSTTGIATAGASGNIRVTGTRTYTAGAHYIYNGTANQIVGNGLTQNTPIGSLTINNTGGVGANTVTLGANIPTITNALTVSNGILAMSTFNIASVATVSMTGTSITGTGTLTLGTPGSITTLANANTASIAAPINLGTAVRTFNVADGAADPDLTVSSIISSGAGGGINKSGLGVYIPSNSNTYSGLTTISAGTLRLGATGGGTNTPLGVAGVGAGTSVTSGATLDLNGFTLGTAETLTINGTGISSGGALMNSGAAATYSGLLTLGSASSIVGGTGAINISNTGTITGATFGLTVGGAQGGSIASIIGTTSGSVAKNDNGTWILSNANTFTGGTTLNAGILTLSNPAALGAAGANLLLNSGTLNLATNTSMNAYNATVAGAATIQSNRATAGAGITHSLGTLSIGAHTLSIEQGANVSSGVAAVQFGNLTMTGAPTLSPGTANLLMGGSASGAFKLTKSASGRLQKTTTAWTLPNDFEITAGTYDANTFSTTVSGLTTVSGSGIYLASTATQTFNGDLTVAGGTFTGSTGNVTSGNITLSSGTLTAPSGTFSVAGNWLQSGGIFAPGANTVTFTSSATQTLNSGGTSFNNLVHSGTGTLQLSAALSTSGTITNSSGIFSANGFTNTVTGLATISGGNYQASTATQTFNGGLTISVGTFTGSTGIVDATNITLSSGTLIAPTGSFTVSGNWTNNGGTLTGGTGTVTFDGTTQIIGGTSGTTFNNIAANSSAGISTAANATIGGTLSIANGTTFTIGGFDFAVTGSTSVGSGTSGNLTFSSATGNKSFSGLVTLGAGSTWTNTINSPVTFQSGITRTSGTFTAGTGLYSFSTNSQSLIGTFIIPNISVDGISLTNNNTLTIGIALSGSGSLTQASGASLFIGGTSAISSLNAINSPNTVVYNGTTQTINATTYHNLTINQSGATNASLNGATVVNGILDLTLGNLNIGANNLTLASAATITNASATTRIIASSSGELRKTLTAINVPFTFPIGDIALYSPVIVQVTAGTVGVSYTIGASVVDAKHPSNASATNFLTRYWNISQTGVSSCVATITATYDVGGDVSGSESEIIAAQLNGTFDQTTNPWVKRAVAALPAGGPLTATGVVLTASQPSACTGISRPNIVVTITNGATANVCNGATLNLTTSVLNGDPTIIYSWSPSTGLSATNISNPVLTGVGSGLISYVVTATDGNGISSTDQIDVTVNPNPVVDFINNLSGFCSGVTVGPIALSASTGGGETFTWSGGASIGLADGSDGVAPLEISSFTASNNGNSVLVATITITATKNGCVSSNRTFTISINPLPDATATNQTICSGATTSIAITTPNGVAGTTYTWIVQSNAGGVTGASAGSGATIAQTLVNPTNVQQTVTYRITPRSGAGCNGAAFDVSALVDPVPTVSTTPASQVICSGALTSITINNPNAVLGTVFNWTVVQAGVTGATPGSGASIAQALTTTVAVQGTATYTITPTAGSCNGVPVVVIVTVNPLPDATASNQTICSGATTSIAITTPNGVAGTTYTWIVQSNAGGVTGASAGSGATIAQTLVNPTNLQQTVTYRITPRSGAGCNGAAFDVNAVVYPAPTFTVTNLTPAICTGSPVNITLNTPTFGGIVTLNTVNYNGVTGTLTAPVNYTNGQQILEVLTNTSNAPITVVYTFSVAANGCSDPVSKQASVVVSPSPTMSIVNATTEICSGSPVGITLNSPTSGAVITLTTVSYGGVTGTLTAPRTYSAGSIISETLINNTNNPVTVTYSFTVAANGCSNATTFSTNVLVNPNPNFAITNTTSTICSGSTPAISVNSPTANSQIALQSVTYGSLLNGAYSSGATFAMTGALAEGNLINNTNNPIVVTYTFSVTTPTNPICPLSVTTQSTTVTVLPAPTLSFVNAAPSICTGSSTNIILNTTVTGAQIRLKTISYGAASGSLTVGALFANGQIISESLTNPTNTSTTVIYEFEAVVSGCAPSASQTINVQVRPAPVITNTSLQLQQTICSGSTLNFLPTSTTDPGTNYTWVSSSTGSFTGVAASGSGTISNTPINTTNTVGFITYTITPEINGCSGTPVNFVVTVNPTPSANGSDITICSGQNALIAISASPANVSGTTFSWIALPSSNVAGASNDNGSTINQILTLTDFSIGTVTYQVTPSANGCTGPVKNIVVTINPIPTVDAGVDYQVCEPTTIPVTGTIGGAATSGTWIVVSGAGTISASTVSGTSVTASYTVVPADVATTIVLRLETNDPDLAGPCSLGSDLVQIQINRRPTVTLVADYAVCEPSNFLASPINLSGIIGGSASSALWSIVSGSGALSATNQSGATATSLYTIDLSDVGTTITLRLTTNDPDGFGPCASEFEDINISINQAAVVSAGIDLQLCQDVPSITLLGSQSGAPTSVVWTGGAGTNSNATVTQPVYSFNSSELNTTITFTITALDPDGAGPCTSVQDQMNLKINLLPVVVFTGFPTPVGASPSQMVENNAPITLTGNQVGGGFTITPATSVIGSTFVNVVDRVTFDPSAVELGSNFVTYLFTDANGCTNSDIQEIFVNPVTNVDFGVQGAVVNANGDFELCANLGNVKLLGFPPPTDGFAPETKFTSEGPNAAAMVIVNIGPDYFIQTNGIVSNNYRIRYTFKNQFGAITFREKPIRIYASPVSQFTSANNCIVDEVLFTDGSTINSTPFPTIINSWQWNFGDNDLSSKQNPGKFYADPGTYNVSLRVTTLQGCASVSAPYSLRIGDLPMVDFNWTAICNFDNTNFLDQTTNVVGTIPAGISVISGYTWSFGDGDVLAAGVGTIPSGTHGGRTFGSYNNPQHKYTSNGNYTTNLLVDTNDGCSSSKSQTVFILPYNTVAPVAGSEYLEGFEATDGGWIPEAFNATNSTPINLIKSDTSWIWGSPTGATIKTAASGTKAWWTGDNTSTYFSNENSVIDGPCFNLSQLNRPMVSLDYFSDSETNLDGAVLQYSINGGFNWIIVGPPAGQPSRDEGINWFNGTGIFSNPGSQPIGNYGWTGKQGAWKNARFNLDMVPKANRNQVRLRIAFSSNDGNAPGNTFDGFAFDNFFVGEKKRNVLVEHFTTSALKPSVDADTYLNTLLRDQITVDRVTSDFSNIQYHVNFFGVDLLNRDNPADPAARALYYGVSQPPYSIMDGLLIPNKLTGITTQLNKVEIDRRALVDPDFELTLDTIATNNNRTISIRLTLRALKAITVPLVAHVALVEEEVNIPTVGLFKNVLRKQLFGSDGETISVPFVTGQVLIKSRVDVEINSSIVDPSKLVLVGFVQDKNSKEIYQSIIVKAPIKRGTPIVAIEGTDPLILVSLNSIQLFPNPANGEFNFGIPGEVHPESQWKLLDQRGVSVLTGDFAKATNGLLPVDVSSLPNAMYFVVISSPGGHAVRKKLMVMNRN